MAERLALPTEVRAEGRTLSGVVMTFGEVSASHRERFEPGSLIREPDCWLDVGHDVSRVICWEGAGLEFEESADALSMRATLPRIPAADVAWKASGAVAARGCPSSFAHWRRNGRRTGSASSPARPFSGSGSSRRLPTPGAA